jgi:hypothetical protein
MRVCGKERETSDLAHRAGPRNALMPRQVPGSRGDPRFLRGDADVLAHELPFLFKLIRPDERLLDNGLGERNASFPNVPNSERTPEG